MIPYTIASLPVRVRVQMTHKGFFLCSELEMEHLRNKAGEAQAEVTTINYYNTRAHVVRFTASHLLQLSSRTGQYRLHLLCFMRMKNKHTHNAEVLFLHFFF